MKRFFLVLGLLFICLAEAQTVTLVAAGDIACAPDMNGTDRTEVCQQEATAKLIDTLKPAAVLVLGDNQYDSGLLEAYEQSYDPSWGRFKAITYPVPGNHEYNSGAKGYYTYFGARAGDPEKGYYSFDLGNWHLLAINSDCEFIGGCGAGSPQLEWLKTDLAAHPAACSLAFWHHPRFSSGLHGNHDMMGDIWTTLQAAGVELVLSGHDHDYERFAPQNNAAQADPQGIRQFVVGTGGRSHYTFLLPRHNSEVRNHQTFGVLKLELNADSYSYQFLPVEGSSFTDSGSANCH